MARDNNQRNDSTNSVLNILNDALGEVNTDGDTQIPLKNSEEEMESTIAYNTKGPFEEVEDIFSTNSFILKPKPIQQLETDPFISSILNSDSYISNLAIKYPPIKYLPEPTNPGKDARQAENELLTENFFYTTYTHIKENYVVGVIVIYNSYKKEFRTILTNKYTDNHLDIIGYVKTLEYALETNVADLKVYTDNEFPNLMEQNIVNEWISLDCMINNKAMKTKPFIYSILDQHNSFKTTPILKRANINKNNIILLLKNIAVKIALEQIADLKSQYYLKNKREELDLEIARLSKYVFSKPIIVYDNNDIVFDV